MCPLSTVVVLAPQRRYVLLPNSELLRELARCSLCLPGGRVVAIRTTRPRREYSESSPLGTRSERSVGLNGGLAGLAGIFSWTSWKVERMLEVCRKTTIPKYYRTEGVIYFKN